MLSEAHNSEEENKMKTQVDKQGRQIVHLTLTSEQLKLLKPLFEVTYGSPWKFALLGQVFTDGMVVKLIDEKTALKMQKATGIKNSKITSSFSQL